MLKPPVKFAVLALLINLFVLACASVPHTGRRQLNMVSDQQINSLSLKAFQEIVAKEPESQDAKLKATVQTIADRISKAAENTDNPGFKWEVRVIDRDVPNAFCLPGGRIVVFSGIVPYAKTEAGLASIIAHETAHAVARHGAERLSQQIAIKGALSIGGELLRNKDGEFDQKTKLFLGALGMGGAVGIILPFSRMHEFEADKIGQIYLAKAGYDPKEAVNLWERMSQIKKPPIPIWLSTHPADSERIAKLNESLPEMMKLYNQAPEKHGVGRVL